MLKVQSVNVQYFNAVDAAFVYANIWYTNWTTPIGVNLNLMLHTNPSKRPTNKIYVHSTGTLAPAMRIT